ncbi:MAG: hypothetical protein DRJ05_18885 [Bacteroidetes bacterium]|nr:MAG: hypothetical protein DRJ05_18885 [Bacteroidota bacterium]
MQNIGELLRTLREKEGYPLRKVAAYLDIDQAILSKVERGQRKLTKEQVIKLADFYNYNEKEMLVIFLSDRVLYEIGDDDYAKDALKLAEEKIEYMAYLSLDKDLVINQISKKLKQFSKVHSAWIYGSFARGDDGPKSDIDVALKTDNGFSYFDLAEVQYKLENEVNRKIDVGFIDSFKPNIFQNVELDLRLIYER